MLDISNIKVDKDKSLKYYETCKILKQYGKFHTSMWSITVFTLYQNRAYVKPESYNSVIHAILKYLISNIGALNIVQLC